MKLTLTKKGFKVYSITKGTLNMETLVEDESPVLVDNGFYSTQKKAMERLQKILLLEEVGSGPRSEYDNFGTMAIEMTKSKIRKIYKINEHEVK